jgi:hypothetical protein
MLSPHEFATLMLIKYAPDEIDLDRAELETLFEHRLVTLEDFPIGRQRPLITSEGHLLLKAVGRAR